jgi:hypothetical protein
MERGGQEWLKIQPPPPKVLESGNLWAIGPNALK